MPPLPKSSRRPSTGKRERGSSETSSSASASQPRSRAATKTDVLEGQISRFYMVVGTGIRPFGRFYPVLSPIGENCVSLADEAAQSWIELGEKDPRVLDVWRSLTGASAWGNVIGIHIAIFASAIPGGGMIASMTQPQPESVDPVRDEFYKQGRAVGLSDEEIEQAMQQTMGGQVPAQDVGSGGPGDTVTAPPAPEHDGSRSATVTAAPPVGQSRAAIVTPEQLGVVQAGMDGDFPHDALPPNGR